MAEHKPLYRWSLEDAVRHNEREAWRESYRENCDCARAIERAIEENYGGAKVVKTSEDGKVDGIQFRVEGNGVNQTVATDSNGQIQIDNLKPGVYTVTELATDLYEPLESREVTVAAGQTATVIFNNTLKRGDLVVTKTAEDGLTEGIKFHLVFWHCRG